MLISFNSYGKWTLFDAYLDLSHAFYIDKDTIRKNAGYIYVWTLIDLREPREGYESVKIYRQVDCGARGHKNLSETTYTKEMGTCQSRDWTPSKN